MAGDKVNKAALKALADQPYMVVDDSVARPLIEAGFAVATSIDPAPEKGSAINITSRGRGALLDGPAAEGVASPA